MTPAAIREAFERLRSDDEMMPLADAARSRSEADWLVGINGTRAMTAFNSKEGGFYLTTVGRVQTPTLAIVVEREDKIREFVSRDYWEVRATFDAKAGTYEGRWFDPKFKKNDDVDARAERMWDAEKRDRDRRRVPRQDRHRHRGSKAKHAAGAVAVRPDLVAARSEFEIRIFREDDAVDRASAVRAAQGADLPAYRFARVAGRLCRHRAQDDGRAGQRRRRIATSRRKLSKQGWVKPNKRVFDNAKVSDHFAIIPTLQTPKHLSEVEAKLYDLVVKRFLSIFFPAAEYLVTTRITEVEGHSFKTEGKVLVEPGWLAIYGREAIRNRGRCRRSIRASGSRPPKCNRSHSQPARRRATRKRRCCRRWKVRAS